MTISTQDELINALGNSAQHVVINKVSLASQLGGLPSSFWRAGGIPAQAAIPTAAEIPNNTTLGAMNFDNPSPPNRNYFGRLAMMASVAATDMQIHDRLGQMGGLLGNSTAVQTVNLDISGTGSNLPARRGDADYSDIQWFLEWYTATGSPAVTATVIYTNADGITGRSTTVALPSAVAAGRLLAIVGNGGEYIQSVQSVQLSAATATAGNFGVTASRPLTSISLPQANGGVVANVIDLGMPRIHDSACLAIVLLPGGSTTGFIYGNAKIIQG